MKEISLNLETFLRFIRDCAIQYDYAVNEVKHCDDQTQDILHKLELEDIKYKERAKYATMLQRIRRERRELKDEVLLKTPIVQWGKSHIKELNELDRLLGEVRKLEKACNIRSYKNKTNLIDEIKPKEIVKRQ